jgi:hypothetical protein
VNLAVNSLGEHLLVNGIGPASREFIGELLNAIEAGGQLGGVGGRHVRRIINDTR